MGCGGELASHISCQLSPDSALHLISIIMSMFLIAGEKAIAKKCHFTLLNKWAIR